MSVYWKRITYPTLDLRTCLQWKQPVWYLSQVCSCHFAAVSSVSIWLQSLCSHAHVNHISQVTTFRKSWLELISKALTVELQTSLKQSLGSPQRSKTNECSGYDMKQFDGEAPVMLKLWGMQSTPSLLLLPGLLRVVAPDRVLYMVQIELFDISTECKWLLLNWIVWNRTVW